MQNKRKSERKSTALIYLLVTNAPRTRKQASTWVWSNPSGFAGVTDQGTTWCEELWWAFDTESDAKAALKQLHSANKKADNLKLKIIERTCIPEEFQWKRAEWRDDVTCPVLFMKYLFMTRRMLRKIQKKNFEAIRPISSRLRVTCTHVVCIQELPTGPYDKKRKDGVCLCPSGKKLHKINHVILLRFFNHGFGCKCLLVFCCEIIFIFLVLTEETKMRFPGIGCKI